MRDALAGLFAPEPDQSLVHLIRKSAASLSPSEVRASLARLRATFDFPVVAGPGARAEPPRGPGRTLPETPALAERTRKEVGQGTPWRNVTLSELIGAGLVRTPLDIEHRYRGTQLTARIEDASHISFGSVYESLSLVGGMARKSVVGAPSGREYPQTNGWTFWEYRRADGTLGVLDELRRAFFEGKVVSLAASRRGA